MKRVRETATIRIDVLKEDTENPCTAVVGQCLPLDPLLFLEEKVTCGTSSLTAPGKSDLELARPWILLEEASPLPLRPNPSLDGKLFLSLRTVIAPCKEQGA